MKQTLLSLLFIFWISISFGQFITVTLNGSVLRDSTNGPVVHHLVIIQSDSTVPGYNFYTTRYTGANGFYDCVIHDAPVGAGFIVSTKDCDSNWMQQTFTADTTFILRNFILCNNTPVGCQARYEFAADSTNPLHVHFFDVSTLAGPLISREWNFGDGGTATTGDPWHTYYHAGKYNVCLTIHTQNGCTDTKCDSITVYGTPPSNCENWMTWTFNLLNYTFTGHTHSTLPTNYYWTFGDGSADTGQVVQHTFPAAGVYVVTLHTVDQAGCEWTRTQEVHVNSNYHLYGYGIISDSLRVDHGIAELIRLEAGSAAHIDTFEIDSAGLYHFDNIVQGLYYVRISLLPSSQWYGEYVTTYYHDAVLWTSAILIQIGVPVNPYNVLMHHVGQLSPGTGTITGTITRNARVNGSGAPMANVEVMLMNESDQVVGYKVTGADGTFSFTSLPAGTFKVYPEVVTVNTTPAVVTLNDTTSTITLGFVMNGNNISGISNIGYSGFSISEIYPNPANDYAGLTVRTSFSGNMTAFIYAATGQLVLQQTYDLHNGLNRLSIPVSGLSRGIYYIRLKTDDGKTDVRTLCK